VTLAILLASPLLIVGATRLAGVLLVAAAIGNGASELVAGTVPNPFVIQAGDSLMAYNLADLYAVAALGLLATLFAREASWRG
jgi:hypothetical protein